jgi:hypothetical protein
MRACPKTVHMSGRRGDERLFLKATRRAAHSMNVVNDQFVEAGRVGHAPLRFLNSAALYLAFL